MNGMSPVVLIAMQAIPAFTVGDARIQTVAYDPNQVVQLRVADGYATLVELSSDERVENVVVGNSAAWQVTANRQGDRLAVKPLAGAVSTNMTVVTDVRQYVFLLEPAAGAEATPFLLRFSYPGSGMGPGGGGGVAQSSAAPAVLPGTYKLSGATELRPRDIFDDGRRTTIIWDAGLPLPATFAVDRRGREQLVNGRMVGERYVVEGIAPRYVFKLGKRDAAAVRVIAKVTR